MSATPPNATPSTKPATPPVRGLERGTCVARYVILDRLGEGGMGVVYRAYDPELDRPIALKILRARDDARWLLREAQALARLQHPNVVAVHDVGTFGGDVFIAMELVEGQSLRKWLKARKRTRGEILDVFVAAGEGLAAAHRAGLVHRDFKPDNLIVGDDGRVRVLDFGLARSARGSIEPPPPKRASSGPPASKDDPTLTDPTPIEARKEPSLRALVGALAGGPTPTPTPPPLSSSGNLLAMPLTHADAIVGTPRYMAPEQIAGEAIDARADQFSFCVTLYQALYGSFPFDSDPLDLDRDWHVEEPPPGSTVPRWLRQVLVKGLAERPGDRFASMNELLAALRADPSARWSAWWRASAIVAIVLVAGGAWLAEQRSRVRECQGAEQELDGIWDDGKRAAIRAAFARSGLPYADAARATVERTFDDYAKRWLAMHVDACEATRVRGEQSQELLDLRMACLADRSTEMKTLSDLFASADKGTVEHAAQSAQSLPGLDLCADAAALKAPIPPPRDARTRERVDAVREELARASALERAARFDEGLVIGRTALAEAESIGYAPVVAEARLRVGRLLGGRGDYAESARALHLAYVSALAGRDDEAAARASTDLILAIGTRQARYDEGDRWADVAEALVGRVQRRDELLGAFYSTRANLREREGKYDDALADAQRAIDIEQRVLGPDHFLVGEAYYHLGAVHYFRAEYAQALDAYRRCLEIQARIVGPDHPVLLGAKVGMADVYGDSGDHPRALAEYQAALAMIQRVRPEDPDIPMIRNNLGGELQQLDRPKEAFEQYELAFADWQKRIGPGKETITALSNMGEAQLAMHAPERALAYYTQALDACTKSLGAEHHLCGRLSWGIGESDRLLGKLDDALESYRRSIAVVEKALGPKHPQLAGPLLGIGRVELARRSAASAKAALERGLAILGDEPGEGLQRPDLRFTLAQALWMQGDRAGARELAAKASEDYAAAGDAAKTELADASAWIASHAH